MDKYHIYEEIGKGDFSQVYKGREKNTLEYVAIKRSEKGVMNLIVNEVQIIHKLSCPHIIRFYDWYETRNNIWLILEYCTGGDLASLVQQDKYLPEASVRMFGLDILAGLKVSGSAAFPECFLRGLIEIHWYFSISTQ
jgi:serine/threonine-protein kinase ULK4